MPPESGSYPPTSDVAFVSEPGTVGIDYLSVGGYRSDGAKVHRILLAAGIWIIEGLDLSAVRAGPYDLICLPVKLHGGDGAPARAILRPVTQGRSAPGTS